MAEAFYKEIKGQYEELLSYYQYLKNSNEYRLLKGLEKETIFFGCGDSYAVSMIMNEILDCEFGDPYEWQFKKLPKGKNFVFVSVSGRTNANINLAKKAKKENNRLIVITGNENSELANIADVMINIRYKERTMLPGSLSYMKSLLASFALFGIEVDFNLLNKEVEKIFSRNFGFFLGEAIFILASPAYYPLAYYLKAKISETLGIKSFAERIEMFNHVDLFYLNRKDGMVFLTTSNDYKSNLLFELIKDKVDYCFKYDLKHDQITNYLTGSIFSQYFTYYLMRIYGKTNFNFAVSEFLEISNKLIY